jgi:hypothetical protein
MNPIRLNATLNKRDNPPEAKLEVHPEPRTALDQIHRHPHTLDPKVIANYVVP